MTRREQSPTFGAVITAMVTPFGEDGALDIDGAATLARWLTEHGSDGLVLAGTTGEGPVLTDAERADLWRCVREAVSVPVIAGAGTNDTRHSLELVALAADIGVDAVLAVTPYYSRPSQAGLFEHFRAVAGTRRPCRCCSMTFRSAPDAASHPTRSCVWCARSPTSWD